MCEGLLVNLVNKGFWAEFHENPTHSTLFLIFLLLWSHDPNHPLKTSCLGQVLNKPTTYQKTDLFLVRLNSRLFSQPYFFKSVTCPCLDILAVPDSTVGTSGDLAKSFEKVGADGEIVMRIWWLFWRVWWWNTAHLFYIRNILITLNVNSSTSKRY